MIDPHAELPARRRRRARRALVSLLLATLFSVASLVLAGVLAFGGRGMVTAACAASALFSVGALVVCAREARARAALEAPGKVLFGFTFAALAHTVLALLGTFLTWVSTLQFTRGRQLRRLGRVLLPPVRPGAAWTTRAFPDLATQIPAALREDLAARWRENGRTEHASVAAFARLTLDLMALGAPPELIADAQRDALDEIRHTEMCFSLAQALDGNASSPAAFPEAHRARTLPAQRTLALATLAVDSLVDGALHEGISAAVLAKLARRTEVPAIRQMLVEIARDEGRHAAHGWDVVAWCIIEGGAPVVAALLGAIEGLPARMQTELPTAAQHGAWERYGIMSEALEAAEHARMRRHIEARVNALAARRAAA